MFRRQAQAVTCEVEFDSRRSSYDVSLVPHEAVLSTIVETFDCASSALRRHAEIASSLRDAGWALDGYGLDKLIAGN